MTITIKKVTTKKELKKFIRFNYELYKDNPYSVPDLYDDMLNTFNPKKNPAFEFCEAEYFLAYKGRSVRPALKCGICGEHGGEPMSVKFCHKVGLDYVSCSPFRVPIARLAAAQAAIEE